MSFRLPASATTYSLSVETEELTEGTYAGYTALYITVTGEDPVPDNLELKTDGTNVTLSADATYNNIYVGDIASSAGVSVSECLRCFRDVMDATPIHFLRSLRLERASELLAQGSGSSVTEVAGQVGFTDMSYFTREFRKQFGKTPREYRKEIRN